MSFTDLELSAPLLKTLEELGYMLPTPIQQMAIPQVLYGRDLFACAQTGTGKTASFILPMIDVLSQTPSKTRLPRAIVLEPTRELAAQVFDNFQKYAKNSALKAALLSGGDFIADQEKALKKGADVLIVTPGRLLDLYERGRLVLTNVKFFVIDEADRMLDMGFIPDVDRISNLLPKSRQTLLFSATLPDDVKKLSAQYLMNPKEVIVTPSAKTADTVTQTLISVSPNDVEKRLVLRKVLRTQPDLQSVIIFCNRKKDVDIVTKSLKTHGFKAEGLHGDMAQSIRQQTLDNFKAHQFDILVASDVAARGIDVDTLNFVVNFDVPINAEDYVHRIGRTGRAGKVGSAVMFHTPKEKKLVAAIESLIKQSIPQITVDIAQELEVRLQKKNRHHGADLSAVREKTKKKSGSKSSKKTADKPLLGLKETAAHISRAVAAQEGLYVRKEIYNDASDEIVVGFGSLMPAFMRQDPLKNFKKSAKVNNAS